MGSTSKIKDNYNDENAFIFLKTKPLLKIIYLVFMLVLIAGSLLQAEPEKKSILVLNSYHHGYRWTDEVMEGFLSSFIKDDPSLDIHIEYMDTKFYDTPDYYELLKKVYDFKYANLKFDLIVVTDNAALNFLKEFRAELFPGAPIVFCGIDHFTDKLIYGMKNITGVVEDYDMMQTINLALSLHPDTKNLAVVCDTSMIGESDYRQFTIIKSKYTVKYKIIEIVHWTEKDLIKALTNLPPNTLVFRFAFRYTSDGVYFDDDKIKDIWEKYCKYPSYTSLGHKIEGGIIGGVLNVGQFHGKIVGDFSHRILNGVPADSIPVIMKSPTQPVFDYLMMKKFGIKGSMLPPESIIINKPFSFYTHYKNLAWGGLAIFLVLSLLILILFINIMKRKNAQETLAENERKYRTLVETVPQGILEVDNNLTITFANTSLKKKFNYSDDDLISKPLMEFIPEKQMDTIRKSIKNISEKNDSFPQYIGKYKTKNGKLLYLQLDWGYKRNATGDVVGFISVISDITERIQAEEEAKVKQEQLIQADKMVALGTLVSGVAHEINNPNNFILINTPILQRIWRSLIPILDDYKEKNGDFLVARFPYEQIRNEYFEICSNILDGTNRIKSIVKDLKEYSRRDMGEKTEKIDINNVISSCINLLGTNIKKYTHFLELDLAPNLPAVQGNYQHFEQILINLIQNACQSLPGKNKPIKIQSVQKNGKIEIRIIDSGIGIPKDNLSRICDPFFTTKRDKGGTGLGLSVSNSLVQKYNGNLRFISKENKGTTAIVNFPVIT